MSNCFGTGFLYAQEFLTVSEKMASAFVFGGGIGWVAVPTIAGFVLEGRKNARLTQIFNAFFNANFLSQTQKQTKFLTQINYFFKKSSLLIYTI